MVSSIRIPPESTGPRVATTKRYILEYDNQTTSFSIGDIVSGATSNASGTVTSIVTEGYGANAGRLYLKDASGTFSDNENIEVSATPYAVADLTSEAFRGYDYQEKILVDPNNPSNKQKIDQYGASLNTFTDGSPVFGAFGTLTIGQPQIIKKYDFPYSIEASHFWDQTASGGTVTHEANAAICLITTPTTSGASVTRTTHYYHPYTPGIGHFIELSIQIGDIGKTNVTRRWGYFDDNNGIYFELVGTDINICKRDNASGSLVTTTIAQADWNQDNLDGTNSQGLSLDVSKANIYWIDLQWLGAGRVRAGIYDPYGHRLVAHEFDHANDSNLPYMRTAKLPIRVEQINTGTAASTSEMRFGCAVVKHTAKYIPTGDNHTIGTGNNFITIQHTNGEEPLLSLRPQTTVNSLTNRKTVRCDDIHFISDSGSESATIFRIHRTGSSNLTGASFADETGTPLQKDTSANAIANTSLTKIYHTFVLNPGETFVFKPRLAPEIHNYEIYLDADGSTQQALVITSEVLGTGNNDIGVFVNVEGFH